MTYQDQIEEITTTLHAQSGLLVYKAVQVEIRKHNPDSISVDIGNDNRASSRPCLYLSITPEGDVVATLWGQNGGGITYCFRLNEKGEWVPNGLETTQEEME